MVGEEGKEKVKEIGAVGNPQGTFPGFQLFSGEGTAKVGEEGGSTEGFEGRHQVLIVVPIPSPVRAGQEVFAEFFGVSPLGGKVIVQSENGYPFIVQMGQDEGSQGPWGTPIV